MQQADNGLAFLFHIPVLTSIVVSLLGLLPYLGIAASGIVGFIFYTIQIYESKTFQQWRHDRTIRKQAKRLAILRQEEALILARIKAIETVRAAKVEAAELINKEKVEAAMIVAKEPVKTEENLQK
jgi:hypothetical protein